MCGTVAATVWTCFVAPIDSNLLKLRCNMSSLTLGLTLFVPECQTSGDVKSGILLLKAVRPTFKLVQFLHSKDFNKLIRILTCLFFNLQQ